MEQNVIRPDIVRVARMCVPQARARVHISARSRAHNRLHICMIYRLRASKASERKIADIDTKYSNLLRIYGLSQLHKHSF